MSFGLVFVRIASVDLLSTRVTEIFTVCKVYRINDHFLSECKLAWRSCKGGMISSP
jgi:hypothetical protein